MSSPRVRLIGVGQDSDQRRNSSPADWPQSLCRPSHCLTITPDDLARCSSDRQGVRGSGQRDLAKRPTNIRICRDPTGADAA
jgi:hypothetical protein